MSKMTTLTTAQTENPPKKPVAKKPALKKKPLPKKKPVAKKPAAKKDSGGGLFGFGAKPEPKKPSGHGERSRLQLLFIAGVFKFAGTVTAALHFWLGKFGWGYLVGPVHSRTS